jgi:hypothetical protein
MLADSAVLMHLFVDRFHYYALKMQIVLYALLNLAMSVATQTRYLSLYGLAQAVYVEMIAPLPPGQTTKPAANAPR